MLQKCAFFTVLIDTLEHRDCQDLLEVLVSFGLCEICLLFNFLRKSSLELHSLPLCAFIEHNFPVPLKWFASSLEMCIVVRKTATMTFVKHWRAGSSCFFFPTLVSEHITSLKVDYSIWQSLSDLVYQASLECKLYFAVTCVVCASDALESVGIAELLFLLVVEVVEGQKCPKVADFVRGSSPFGSCPF